MSMTLSQSPTATAAYELVTGLQRFFADQLVAATGSAAFSPVSWLRDEGAHGGGARLQAPAGEVFNRGSVNVSQVHYDDDPSKRLASATALSTIIHPASPLAPSVHVHISWTDMKDGSGYWRMMADLNPAIANADDTARFKQALQAATPDLYAEAAAEGDRYFYIPALERHRGVTHYYAEQFSTGNFEQDRETARTLGEAALGTYSAILGAHLQSDAVATAAQQQVQRDYHTLYLFQVLTLDRGTTSGLLVHNQNDVGVLGSIPATVNRDLLASWQQRVDSPQDALVASLVEGIPASGKVDDQVKAELAKRVRLHYQQHPEALAMQARGSKLPPTVANHGEQK